ncbi:MAG: protein translocase subunit SecD [Rubricoccaceae bacterium]
MQGYGFRLFALGALILLSLFYLFPTVQNSLNQRDLDAMAEDERAMYEEENARDLQATKERSLNLGLDLQGGMHVTLEVESGTLLRELAEGRTDEVFDAALASTIEEARTSREDFVTLFTNAVEEEREGTQLARYFRNQAAEITARSTNSEVADYLRLEVDGALDRAVEIIRQRVDRYGVTEPSIQKQGASRIVVELPGVDDPERVRDLLKGTAKLTFHLTPPTQEVQAAAQRIAQFYAEGGQPDAPVESDTSAVESTTIADSTAVEGEIAEADEDTTNALDVASLTGGTSSSASQGGGDSFAELVRFAPTYTNSPVFGEVLASDTAAVRRLMTAPGAQALLPPGVRVLFTARAEGVSEDGEGVYQLVAIRDRVELEGDVITDARPDFDPLTNAPKVSLTMNSEGARAWSQLTAANIEKPVAIVLDDVVYTFPTIQGRIPNGRTEISGVNADEAEDVVTVLKSGALPAPVNIMQERTVGPSLGARAIKAGLSSLIIGFALVCVFMVIYYRTAGLVADVALLLNVLFIFGILAAFRATLTLPGFAGIVLTIGMAVDANVLIFERIREEMASGKTLRASVDGGFAKALSAIADANITTFLIGVILYSFGMGPIQGFAVTLMAGILTSLFTALVVTRLIIDYLVRKRGSSVAFG